MKSCGAKRRFVPPVGALATLVVAEILLAGQPYAQYEDKAIDAFVLTELLEYRTNVEGSPLRWDVFGWLGNRYSRFWFKTEGDLLTTSSRSAGDVRALYGRLIAPFWDLQAGLRLEARRAGGETDTRAHFVLGLQGLAPYRFELEPELFISQEADVSGRLTGAYDLLLTQRLIAQGRLETSAAVQEVKEFGVGSGVNDVELGVRIRYEKTRGFAPYAGVSWARKLGRAASLARSEGEDVSDLALVVGLRVWR